MGLLKKIGKGFKKIFKGVTKVFRAATKFVGKIVGSKWGRVLMGAAAIFTGGMALAAGVKGFGAAQGGFLTKFLAGGKEFLGALVNPIGKAREMFGQGAGVSQASALQSAEMAGGPGEMLAQGAQQAVQTPGDLVFPGGGVPRSPTPPVAGGGGGGKGLLGGVMDFARSPGGGQIISGAIGGLAQAKMEEERLKEEERIRRYYDKAWKDPGQLATLNAAAGRDINVPQGYLDRARQQYDRQTGSSRDSRRSFTFGGQ